MNVQNLITEFGTQAEAAREIGRAKQTLTGWKSAGIPYSTQCELWFEFPRLRKFKPCRKDAPEGGKEAA